MLLHEEFQLALKLSLLLLIREDGDGSAVIQGPALRGPKRGHVLDHEKADFITCLIVQRRLDFDLFQMSEGLTTSPGNSHACEPY